MISNSRKLALGFILATALVAAPSTTHAFPACDDFGQDWNIVLGPFGGVFPGTLLVSGCRDCDASFECSPDGGGGTGPFPIDGAAVVTAGTGGAPFSLLWSITTFDAPADGCVSAHWTGFHPSTSPNVMGRATNESGTAFPFTLSLGASCRVGAEVKAGDPNAPR